MTKPTIGFIGLGLMGSAMVGRLQDQGYEVTALANVSRTAIDAAIARGASEASDAKSLADAVDIVMLCVGTSDQVEGRMRGDDGVIAGLSAGKVVIDFVRHHLTNLDPVVFKDENLPPELFIELDRWIKPISRKLKMLKDENELRDDKDHIGIPAQTHLSSANGTYRSVDVNLVGFEPTRARILVRNEDLRLEAWRSRLYVITEGDNVAEMEELRKEIVLRRAETLQYLRVQKLINEHMTQRFSFLRLSNEVLKRIQSRILVDLFRFNPDSVRKIIVQIEALYVFAILKSSLYSQKSDPFIKGLLFKYKVHLDSPALRYFKPEYKEKHQLEGLRDYNMKGIKMELDHNSLLLMDQKYIKLPQFLNSLTEETIGVHKLFRFPFDIDLLMTQNHKDLREFNSKELQQEVNVFPLYHDKFVLAQKLMSHYFHQVAKYRWAEAIQKEMYGFIKDDFDFDQGKELRQDQIDPVLLRLFFQLKLYMQNVLFQHFETALKEYTSFLLRFIMRDPVMRLSKTVKEVKMNPFISLTIKVKERTKVVPGEVINDVELLPLQTKPMIKVSALIEDFQVPGRLAKKQKIATSPDLDTVQKDLFSIIQEMHTSLEGIDRIDAIVFPLLKLDEKFLAVPDTKSNDKLAEYLTVIEKLIEQSLKPIKKEMHNLAQFMSIFERRVDTIIIKLKKRSFALQQDLTEGLREDDDAEHGQDPKDGTEKKAKEDENSEDKEDSQGDDPDDDGEEDNEAEMAQYKSQEVDDNLYKEELFFLRDLVWKILESI